MLNYAVVKVYAQPACPHVVTAGATIEAASTDAVRFNASEWFVDASPSAKVSLSVTQWGPG